VLAVAEWGVAATQVTDRRYERHSLLVPWKETQEPDGLVLEGAHEEYLLDGVHRVSQTCIP
jgi:hypothetical protein